jgi:methylphosphotriester-DNA--protein-cysteine methyltransferase
MMLTYDEMAAAMRHKDGQYNGRFYIGVLSTGIFCLPSCRARSPLLKNVRFFSSREEAIAAGLRGCKRCRAERFPDTLPEWLPLLLRYLANHRAERLTEHHLTEIAGVAISTIRRYFHTHLHTTPLAFHRRLRLEYARELLASGCGYLAAAYECGYESPSAFRDAFARQFGQTPTAYVESQNRRA